MNLSSKGSLPLMLAVLDQPRLLLVEDEPVQQGFINGIFTVAGYAVVTAGNFASARVALMDGVFDLVILDLGLPDGSGYNLIPLIQYHSSTGIIILTRMDKHSDRIQGLELGIDDYLTKPFDPQELLLRARNLRRRISTTNKHVPPNQRGGCRFGYWRVDFNERLLTHKGGQTSVLTPSESRILHILIDNAGKTVPRWNLSDSPRSADWLILRLRRKLLDNGKNPTIIVGVRSLGYRFDAEVHWES